MYPFYGIHESSAVRMLHANEDSLFSYGGGALPLNLPFGVFANVDAVHPRLPTPPFRFVVTTSASAPSRSSPSPAANLHVLRQNTICIAGGRFLVPPTEDEREIFSTKKRNWEKGWGEGEEEIEETTCPRSRDTARAFILQAESVGGYTCLRGWD